MPEMRDRRISRMSRMAVGYALGRNDQSKKYQLKKQAFAIKWKIFLRTWGEIRMPETSLRVHIGRTDRRPADAGMDENRLQELERYMAGLVDQGRLQGASWLVARDGHIVAHHALGRRTFRADSDGLKPDAVRPVYSITKVITAVAVMMLIEDGKLYLMQPVADWLKPFDHPMLRPINLWHLLTHTSGLDPDPGFDLEPYEKPRYGRWIEHRRRQEPDRAWTADDIVQLLVSGPVRTAPGREWLYSTVGYVILAEVISRAAGMPYERFVEERIFRPLGMNRSFFRVPGPLHDETCVVNGWEEAWLKEGKKSDVALPPGGNGMFSTLEDLWRFGQAMLDDGHFGGVQILGRRMVREMTSNQLYGVTSTAWGKKYPKFEYGIGWSLHMGDLCSPGSFGHEGFGRCLLIVDPAERLVFVCFAPSQHEWVPESVNAPQNIVWSALS